MVRPWLDLSGCVSKPDEWLKLWNEIRFAAATSRKKPESKSDQKSHFNDVANVARQLVTLLDKRPLESSLELTLALERLAREAQDRANNTDGEQRLVERWTGPKLLFVRILSRYFVSRFKKPLHATTAAIASVALGIDLDRKDVEKAVAVKTVKKMRIPTKVTGVSDRR